MSTYPMHYRDNAHSLRRVGQLAWLYWPGMRAGFIICAVLPLLAVLASAGITRLLGYTVDWIIQWPVMLLLYLSPVMLTRRDYRSVSAQLPVTATEKLGLLLLTFWIVVPALIWLSGTVGEWLGALLFGSETMQLVSSAQYQSLMKLSSDGIATVNQSIFFSIVSSMVMISITLYYAVTARKNRVLACILSLVVANVAMVLLAGLSAGVVGFIAGYNGRAAGQSDEEIIRTLNGYMIWVLQGMLVVFVGVGMMYLIKLYKRLRNSGF